MSRLLYRLSYSAAAGGTARRTGRATPTRAPIGNRTLDLLLTMETLCRLSYWGVTRGVRRGVDGSPRYTAAGRSRQTVRSCRAAAFGPGRTRDTAAAGVDQALEARPWP